MFSLLADSAWKVFLISLLVGAGLPAIFALGVRAMAYGAGGSAELALSDGRTQPAHPLGKVLGILCFVLVVAGIALGISIVVASGFGMRVSFDNIFPTFVRK